MKYLALLFIFIMPLCAIAAEPIGKGQVLRGNFTEVRNLQGFKEPLKSSGHFVVAPEAGIIWVVEKPFAVTTIIKPDGIKQKINGTNTMDLPADKIPFLTRLYNMLASTLQGNWALLEGDFKVEKLGTDKNWQVHMTPQKPNPAMPFSSINVKGSKFADEVKMLKNNGDDDSIKFTQQKLATGALTPAEAALFK